MKKTAYDYHDLKQSIDSLIGKFGLQKTIEIIDSLTSNTELNTQDKKKVTLLLVFIILQNIVVFDLKEEIFYISIVKLVCPVSICLKNILITVMQRLAKALVSLNALYFATTTNVKRFFRCHNSTLCSNAFKCSSETKAIARYKW